MGAPPDFEAMYRGDADPWRVASSHYEQRKLEVVLACLLRPGYRFAWDPASGTGHLAARLVSRADRVLATDSSEVAAGLSAELCGGGSTGRPGGVEVAVNRLPARPASLDGRPDLVVLSEFFYYLDDADRAETMAMIDDVAAPVAEVLAVHWRFVPDDAWLGGAGAQQEIISRLSERGWSHRLHHDDVEFVLDVLERRPEG